MSKRKTQCYIIKDKDTNMLQGAFPFTDEGKKHAEKYLKKINKGKNFKIEVQ